MRVGQKFHAFVQCFVNIGPLLCHAAAMLRHHFRAAFHHKKHFRPGSWRNESAVAVLMKPQTTADKPDHCRSARMASASATTICSVKLMTFERKAVDGLMPDLAEPGVRNIAVFSLSIVRGSNERTTGYSPELGTTQWPSQFLKTTR